MHFQDLELFLLRHPIFASLSQKIIYFNNPKIKTKRIKEIMIQDDQKKEKHCWIFYFNQFLRSYQKYSLKHQKVISEKVFYPSGQLRRYTEYDLYQNTFLYNENYDQDGCLINKQGILTC
ncbi:hypothetical protein AXA84_0260 [Candidatus Phytoplasma oryzae]|uniref:Uncharacterized protein n=1 Tax=Candidatus Phytoplasma oryzae TaxID=203274 RepID=A0A139JQH4_9MOLU|nr:hypothetical protein [Candidatus Phytoplasma oryzae]KXT29231.1 hypothetical protein AXA84_0260 [Candidatus Phytoplasma oryzae]